MHSNLIPKALTIIHFSIKAKEIFTTKVFNDPIKLNINIVIILIIFYSLYLQSISNYCSANTRKQYNISIKLLIQLPMRKTLNQFL